jgi:hypothetical protein
MPKIKYPASQGFCLSREALNVLDDISKEFGDVSRRVAIELLARFAKATTEKQGLTYCSLLLKDSTPGSIMPHLDRRRKAPSVTRSALSK